MYYCHTRYYMPRWCRWLNADNINYLEPENINGMNLYQYCNNDPISGYDPNGTQSINMFLRNITNQIIYNLIVVLLSNL